MCLISFFCLNNYSNDPHSQWSDSVLIVESPADVDLSIADSLEATKVDEKGIYAGSTELETAAHLLQTPIKVFYAITPFGVKI